MQNMFFNMKIYLDTIKKKVFLCIVILKTIFLP